MIYQSYAHPSIGEHPYRASNPAAAGEPDTLLTFSEPKNLEGRVNDSAETPVETPEPRTQPSRLSTAHIDKTANEYLG